jgi:hypothetical protein
MTLFFGIDVDMSNRECPVGIRLTDIHLLIANITNHFIFFYHYILLKICYILEEWQEGEVPEI